MSFGKVFDVERHVDVVDVASGERLKTAHEARHVGDDGQHEASRPEELGARVQHFGSVLEVLDQAVRPRVVVDAEKLSRGIEQVGLKDGGLDT